MSALPVIAGTAADSTATIHLYLTGEPTGVALGMRPGGSRITTRGARIFLAGITTIDTVADRHDFTLDDIRPGTYLLVVNVNPYQPESLTRTLRAGETWFQTVYLTKQGPRKVWGLVTDYATKAPLRSAVVSINGTAVAARTDRHGMYRIPDIPRGHRQLQAEVSRFLANSEGVTVAGGDSLRVDFALIDTFRPRELVCSVVDAVTGEALSHATLSIPGTSRRVTPTQDSLYRLHAIPWHPAEIKAEAQGYQTISLVPGQLLAKLTKLAIPVAPAGWTGVCGVALGDTTYEPLVGASMLLCIGDSLVVGCAAGKHGLFAFPDVKPGDYNLVCSYIGFTDVKLSIEVRKGEATVLLIRLQPHCI